MRKCKIYFLLLFLINSFAISVYAEDIPVILRVKREGQPDSLGTNIVEQLTSAVYENILNGTVKLWDSRQKEIQITGTTLRELEKSSHTSFLDQQYIFIYEMWTKEKDELNAKTAGFQFFNKDSRGEDVAYGYVEYADVREMFLTVPVKANADGNYGESLATYIINKKYEYSIVQFGEKVLSSVGESNDLKKNYISQYKFNAGLYEESTPIKFVSFIVDNKLRDDSLHMLYTRVFINTLENYLTENKEEFYNLGGDRVQSYINNKGKVKISKIEITEFRRKMNSITVYDPRSITIFIGDSSLNTVSFTDFIKFDLQVGTKNLSDMIIEKPFTYIITQINDQIIPRKESYLYYKAFKNSPWNRLMEWVRDNQ